MGKALAAKEVTTESVETSALVEVEDPLKLGTRKFIAKPTFCIVSERKKLRQQSPAIQSPAIARLLGRVRWRIRTIVLGEGIAMSLVVFMTTFWIAFALDYFPVRFGYAELPTWGRVVLLLLSLLSVAWVFYRLVLARFFVRLKDTSMAMLVEKKYHQFNDSLLTTVGGLTCTDQVEVVGRDVDVSANDVLIAATKAKAESLVGDVDVVTVVRGGSFRLAGWIAASLLCSAGLLVLVQPSVASLAFKRLYLLDGQKWPRQTQLEFAGVTVKREQVIEAIPELNAVLLPVDGVITVAKGSSLAMSVLAVETADTVAGGSRQLQIPATCWLNYRTLDGSGGSEPFRRIGSPRAGKQAYALEGPPLENLMGDMSFDVLGGDDRIERVAVRVVDKPVVEKTWLHLRYPDYMVNENSTAYVDQVEEWTGQKVVPVGTRVEIEAKSKTELSKVYLRYVGAPDESAGSSSAEPMQELSVVGDRFRFEMPIVGQETTIELFLCDSNGVVNEKPHVVTVGAVVDLPPEVDCRLAGIGNAVTPDVQIPFKIKLDDDYGLGEAWVEIEIGDRVPTEEPLSLGGREIETTIDFRERRKSLGEKFRLPVEGDQQLSLVVVASDRFNLGGAEPNVGFGDRYDLKIVSADELLRILEQAEVGQRRRLEQIVREINELRGYLVRSKSSVANDSMATVEPGDRDAKGGSAEPGERSEGDDPQRDELRRLFAQRAILQNDKSKQEIMSCARAFEDFRMQLINNRVSADSRQERFEVQVIAPLRLAVESPMSELSGLLDQLEEQLRAIEMGGDDKGGDLVQLRVLSDQVAGNAIEVADQVLVSLNSVLALLIKHETQNELLDIVRQMILQQKLLQDRTKKLRQKKAFEGLLD